MIYIISPDYMPLPAEKYGGIERVIVNLADGFISLGKSVKVLCQVAKEDPVLVEPTYTEGLNVVELGLNYHSDKYVAAVKQYLENELNENDLVLLNHIEQSVFIKEIEQKKARYFEVTHYRNTILKKNLVFPSKLSKLLSFKAGTVIPHPTSYNEFYRVDEKPMIDGKYLLCVGRICKNKRTHLAVKLAQGLGVECVLAGPVHDDKYFKTFENKVTYLGNVDSSILRNLYSNAYVSCCLTSIYPPETFGLFQVEALLCGSPVISSKTGGLFDTFNSYGCVEYRGYNTLSSNIKKISSFLNNFTDEVRSLSVTSTRSNFCNEPVAKKYLELFNL